jgi:hypothetical protein
MDLNRALYIFERALRIAFLPVLLLLAGCVISPRIDGNGNNNNPPPPTSGGQLYVATPNSILRFSQALSANGNVQPAGTISGSSTQLSNPRFLHSDTANERLIVANTGNSSILIFNSASTLTGNPAPSAVIAGSATGLSSPVDTAIDAGNNFLYVADDTNILVFSGESGLSGNVNVAPVRTFQTGVTISAILLDTSNDTLYVADATDNEIIVFGQASLQVFTGTPSALIQGSSTQLFGPNGLALDGTGRLVVSNAGTTVNSTPSVTIYSNPTVANGNILPDTIIAGGSTGFAVPSQLALAPSSSNGELFIADVTAQKISIYNNATNLRGNVSAAPDATIAGANTGLSGVNIAGMALDPTR